MLGNNTTDDHSNSNSVFNSILSEDNLGSSVTPPKSTNKTSDDWSIRKREELADDVYNVLLRSMGIREPILALGIR